MLAPRRNSEPKDFEAIRVTGEDEAPTEGRITHPESGADFWEEEATRTFGPPEARAEKNRRYVSRLVRKHSEQTIRGLLKALSKLEDPMCCSRLAEHDLDAAPLEEIIRPYELLGLDFKVKRVSETQMKVEMGEAYGEVGSGGGFILERVGPGSYRIVEELKQWIA